jgi:hypothetical protein
MTVEEVPDAASDCAGRRSELELSHLAQEDLVDIDAYIAQNDPGVGLNFSLFSAR